MRPLTDAQKLAVVAEAINATVRLERAQSAAGDARQRPRYERAVTALLTLVLGREPEPYELDAVLS
jgi:hypothetical protein